nr:collagen alpha-1(I) chain-like [Oryctolagus cuniculus]
MEDGGSKGGRSKNTTASKTDTQVLRSWRMKPRAGGVCRSMPAGWACRAPGPRPPALSPLPDGREGSAAHPWPVLRVCSFRLESHECSRCESASGTKTGRSAVREVLYSPSPGSSSRVGQPGEKTCRDPSPRSAAGGQDGWGGAAGGPSPGRFAQNGSSLSKQSLSLTQGARGSSRPASGRPGDTKEPWRNFFSPSRRRSAGTAPRGPRCERGSAAPRGRSPAPGSQPPPAQWREPFPRVSKKSLLSRAAPPPAPRAPPASLPGGRAVPGPCASFVWLRRAGLRRVELSPRRQLGAAGLAPLLRDRSHDTGKLRQDGRRYPARHGGPCAPAPRPLRGPPDSPPPPPSRTAARPFGSAAPGKRGRSGAEPPGRGARGPAPAPAGTSAPSEPATYLSSGPGAAGGKARPPPPDGDPGGIRGEPRTPALPSLLFRSLCSFARLSLDFAPSRSGVCSADARRTHHVNAQQEAASPHPTCWHLQLGLPSLLNCKKFLSVLIRDLPCSQRHCYLCGPFILSPSVKASSLPDDLEQVI